jgi:hypothetical protein
MKCGVPLGRSGTYLCGRHRHVENFSVHLQRAHKAHLGPNYSLQQARCRRTGIGTKPRTFSQLVPSTCGDKSWAVASAAQPAGRSCRNRSWQTGAPPGPVAHRVRASIGGGRPVRHVLREAGLLFSQLSIARAPSFGEATNVAHAQLCPRTRSKRKGERNAT